MECLEGVVPEERGPHDRLQDGDDVFARAAGLLQVSDQRTDEPEAVDDLAVVCHWKPSSSRS